ncbi:hypothetical protein [Bacillus velezensis]|uniref:hypothetical protein n=1 Tax=Bacillus velezensis TaxID=492670 RepID=UPI001E394674|nr:hypothetical protein [Bacillus velezensis]
MEEKQFNRLQLAAESGAIPYVVREAEKLAHLIPDFTSFEQECYQAIGRSLENLSNNGREKKALIRQIIRETRSRFLKNRRSRNEVAIEAINEEGTVWEPVDTLASVEGEVLLKKRPPCWRRTTQEKLLFSILGFADVQTIRRFPRCWRNVLAEMPDLIADSSNDSDQTVNAN